MKVHEYKSKVMTDYSNNELTLSEIIIKKRLVILKNANKKLRDKKNKE